MKCGIKHGFREIVMRSPGRFELSLLHCHEQGEEFQHPSLTEIEKTLGPLIAELLEEESLNDLKRCHVSIVTANPGAEDQGWHSDGGHVSVDRHLPCHVLNVFIPLIPIDRLNGPTELRPGSHYLTRNLAPLMLAARARKSLRKPIAPLYPQESGGVLIFDYRILHRGRANLSDTIRPILVLTYSKKWYTDVCNFPKRSFLVKGTHS